MLKEEVLSLLLNAREPVSGEGICKTFGVTRAAVWKTIDQLRQEGYRIDAAPKRGYTASRSCPNGSIRRSCVHICLDTRGRH